MDNIVNLSADRRRPRRRAEDTPSSARILFFTGVRYCRDADAGQSLFTGADDLSGLGGAESSNSGLVLDLAAH